MGDRIRVTAFDGERRLAAGSSSDVALVVKAALREGRPGPVLTFDDRTGRAVDFDLRGTDEEIAARLRDEETPSPVTRAAGRPKLGVVLRAGARADILILPRHARLAASNRAQVRLVLIEGIVRYGDQDYARRVAPRSAWRVVRVDGRTKILDSHIAERLSHAQIGEVGLELSNATWRAA